MVEKKRGEQRRGTLQPSLSGALVSTSRCAAPADCDDSIESSIDRRSPPCVASL